MKAQDLRIGNYVQLNDKITQVDVIDYNQIIATEYGLIELKYIKPISITEQWLIDLGFKQHDEHNYYYIEHNNNEFILIESDNGFILCDMDIHCKISTVHHLQNVCYDLIGLELTKK